MQAVKVAVLGATGAVGTEILNVMRERNFPVSDFVMLADPSEAGKKIEYNGKEYTVQAADENSFKGTDITLVAVEGPISMRYSPMAAAAGSVVIDNSSAYRLYPKVPLIVPEVNPGDIDKHEGIISNPNCSTIIAMVPLKPLHDFGTIRRLTVSTYQAVSGAGVAGTKALVDQTRATIDGQKPEITCFAHQIAFNLIPMIGDLEENGYTDEEMKMLNEGRKILHAEHLQVNCTCVRVPVFRSHSESITIETEREITVEKARELLKNAPGVKLVDDAANGQYPMPLDTSDQDLIYVGRIRKDKTAPNSLQLWVAGDQVRKGAATNAVQIAELVAAKLGK